MEAFQSFTLCPSNGLSTTNKENEPSSVPPFLQDKNRSVYRPIQESSLSEVKRVIRASPFEDVVHKRNLPKSGTISPLNSEEYQAWKAGLKREVSPNHVSPPHGTRKRRNTLSDPSRRTRGTSVQPWPLRQENDNDSWKAKFLRSEISRTQLSTNLMTILEENRKLRIKTMRLEAALVEEQERTRNHHHFHLNKEPKVRLNKGTQTSEMISDVGNKPVPENTQDIKCETTLRKSGTEDKALFEEETNESSQSMEDSSLMNKREASESKDYCSATQVSALGEEKNSEGDFSVIEDRSQEVDSSLVLDNSHSSTLICDNVIDASLNQAECKEKNDSVLAPSSDNQREICENGAPVSEQDESNSKLESNEINLDSKKEMHSFQINSRRGCRGLPTSPDDESVSIVFGEESPDFSTQSRMTISRNKGPKYSIEADDDTSSNPLLEDAGSKLDKSSGEEKSVHEKKLTRSGTKKNRADSMVESIDSGNLSLSPIEKTREDDLHDIVSISKHEEYCSMDKQKENDVRLFDNVQAPALLEDADKKLDRNNGEEKEKSVLEERITRSRAKKNRADAMVESIDSGNLSLSPIEKKTEDNELNDLVPISKHEGKENCCMDKQKKKDVSLFANFQAPALKRRRRLRR